MARIKFRIQRPWIPYIIFVVSLTLTLLTTYYVSGETYTEDHLRFQNAVQDTNTNIENRLQTYIALLRGSAGLFAADPTLTEAQFSAYVNRLILQKNYPGAQAIGFLQKVDNTDKNTFIQSIQNQGDTDFTIKPEGNRAVYYPLLYSTRQDKKSPIAIGNDFFVDPLRRSAMEKARDTGQSETSGKEILINQPTNVKETGFLIFTPVYTDGNIPSTLTERKNDIEGFVFIPFFVNQLLSGILEDKKLPQLLNYQIYDGTTLTSTNLLHDSRMAMDYIPRFEETRYVVIAGRTWTIVYTNHPQFDLESEKNLPAFIFFGGLFVSIIFFMLSRSQYIARTNAEIAATKLQLSQVELKKAISHRDNFISIASHELKTPVTSLKVYAEVLLRQFNKKHDHKTTDYLTKINRQINKLTLLIQDLLDVSRMQSNQLTFRIERFDVNEMANEVIESTQQISDHHHIVLEGTITRKVWGDKERISQVLVNLLTNALKYSPKSDKVIVTMHQAKEEALISVKDFGIGISKEYQKRIFDRFYRINETNEQTYPGLGIGLFISQEIIKRHGGEIVITSKKGQGSVFQFTLPFNKKQANIL